MRLAVVARVISCLPHRGGNSGAPVGAVPALGWREAGKGAASKQLWANVPILKAGSV